jgi:hypothetical protein
MIGTSILFTGCAYYKAVNLPSFSRPEGHSLRINGRKRIFELETDEREKKNV